MTIEGRPSRSARSMPCEHALLLKSEIQIPRSEILPTPSTRALLIIYALATTYLLLFNPRTENNSYLILSPVIALLGARAYFVERRSLKAALLGMGAVFIFAGHAVCRLLTPQAGMIWTGPLVCLLFAADLVRDILRPSPEVQPDRNETATTHSLAGASG